VILETNSVKDKTAEMFSLEKLEELEKRIQSPRRTVQ
jgi:hypothetical protein